MLKPHDKCLMDTGPLLMKWIIDDFSQNESEHHLHQKHASLSFDFHMVYKACMVIKDLKLNTHTYLS